MNETTGKALPTAVASRLIGTPDGEGFPAADAWTKTKPIEFDWDWRGENADAGRATEVRLLWAPETLFLRFQQKYRTITVFPDSRADGWRYELWDRDVAETFLQPDTSDPLRYKEFEVAPNGMWIDLQVSHGAIEELHSGLKRRVTIDEAKKTWTAEVAIPMKSLTEKFSEGDVWRANFYRVEGEKEPRFYAAWSPTGTDVPKFHVPEKFGRLVFR